MNIIGDRCDGPHSTDGDRPAHRWPPGRHHQPAENASTLFTDTVTLVVYSPFLRSLQPIRRTRREDKNIQIRDLKEGQRCGG